MLSNHQYLLNWKFVQSLPSSLQSARMASVQDTAALMACFASAASFFLGHKSPFRGEMGGTWWNKYHYIDSQTRGCATRISCFLFQPFSYDSVPCPCQAHVIHPARKSGDMLYHFASCLQDSHPATGESLDKNTTEETERCTAQPEAIP